MNDSICASICAGTFLNKQKLYTMTLKQAKQASDILQKINSANELIKLLYLNDIENITFNRKSSNFYIIELNLIDSIKTDSIRFLEYEIEILKKQLNDL